MRGVYKAAAVMMMSSLAATGLAADVERTYRDAQRDRFKVFEIRDNALHIPDYISVYDEVIEVVQGNEKERFEPIKTIEMDISLGADPKEALKSKLGAYEKALDLATVKYERDANERPRIADGFSVDFKDDGERSTAVITLYDATESYKEKLIKSIYDLIDTMDGLYGPKSKFFEELRRMVDNHSGSVGTLKLIEEELRDISKKADALEKLIDGMTHNANVADRTTLNELLRELSRIRGVVEEKHR